MMSRTFILVLLAHVFPVWGVITGNCSAMVYKAAADPSTQYGYNLCNATTEVQTSLCQTGFVNGLDDFCLWGPADPVQNPPLNDNQQERTVAWCTKPGHGTRLISSSAFYTITHIKTPSYIEIHGVFNYGVHESLFNYLGNTQTSTDYLDAQLDPRGVDGRGNPIGGLMFSNAFNSNSSQNGYVQAVEWNSLIGWDVFYVRVCDPNVPGSAAYCTRWDNTNLRWTWAAYQTMGNFSWDNNFQSCLGDSRPLGLIVDGTGTTLTYTGQALPTSASFPPAATSSCTTYNFNQLFGATPTNSPGAQACSPSPTVTLSVGSSTTASNTPHSSHNSSAMIGAIVGSIIGVLILVGFAVAFILWRKRRRQRQNIQHASVAYSAPPTIKLEPYSPQTHPTSMTPFSIPINTASSAAFTSTDRITDTNTRVTDSNSNSNSRGTESHSGSASGNSRRVRHGPRPFSPTTASIFSSPPDYADLSEASMPLSGGASVMQPDDELGGWATDNRNLIPYELEQKLRAASYLPQYNPDEIPAGVWQDRYGVGHFELKTIRELYARRQASQGVKNAYSPR